MTRTVAALMIAVAAAALFPGAADAEPAHSRPQGPAAAHFPADFPALVDHEWGFRLGGFGGIRAGAPLHHAPVIFVHGNNVDAADWYPVRDQFRAAGWTDQELWGISYNGLGSNVGTGAENRNPDGDAEHQRMGWDGQVRVTNDDANVPDLDDFIRAVRHYTGSTRFSIVAHSLGVTLARRTLQLHPELRPDLAAFVAIAGANHGTSFCPPGSEGQVVSCNEIAAGTKWLADLNGRGGADETYAPARWLTIYDGSGAGDPGYAGPTYAASPALKGAENRQFPGTYHNDLRLAPPIVAVYRTFVEAAAGPPVRSVQANTPPPAPRPAPSAGNSPPAAGTARAAGRSLAATGSTAPAGLGVCALAAGWILRRTRRRGRHSARQ